MPTPLREIAIKPFHDLFLIGRTCWCADVDKESLLGFDIETGKQLAAIEVGKYLALRASAKLLGTGPGGTQLRDPKGKKLRKLVFDTEDDFSTQLDGLDCAGRLGVGTDRETFVVWDPATGKVVHSAAIGYRADADIAGDGSEIAIVAHKRNLQLVDPKTFARRVVEGSAMKMGPRLAWSSDPPLLAMTVSLTTFIVDRAKGRVLAKLKTPRSSQAVFIPGRGRFVMGERQLTVFDVATWKPVGTVPVAGGMIAASEDGERIVTCGRDGPLRVWATDELLGGTATAKPRPSRPPRGQPIRGVFFGVPRKVTRAALVRAATNLHYILDRQPPDFAMELLLAGNQRDRHWFRFLGTRGRNYLLEPWIECLHEDLQVPLDVVLRAETSVRARRFSPEATEISVPDDYLDAARVADPILVVKGGKKHGKVVQRDDIKKLINTVELYYPSSFSGAKSVTVPRAR